MISSIFLLDEGEDLLETYQSFCTSGNAKGRKFTLEATTRSDILCIFSQGNCVFIREKLVNFEKPSEEG